MKFLVFLLATATAAVGGCSINVPIKVDDEFAYSDGEISEIEELLEDNPVVFVPYTKLSDVNSAQIIDNRNNNAEMAFEYYFKVHGKTVKGEMYKTERDAEETLNALKSRIVSEVESGAMEKWERYKK